MSAKRRRRASAAPPDRSTAAPGPTLLAGGNPQIPKADGEAPVRAYIDAMPGWKRAIGAQLDGLVAEVVPDVRRAVRWNSPFYGTDNGWFLSYHCFTTYVKVVFLNGSALQPPPPEASKDPNTRYLHLGERAELDVDQFRVWVRQAASLPGWHGF